MEGDVVTDAKDEFDQYSKPAVSMTMNSDGARRWAQLTKQNIGRSIAIVLDNYVYSAPNVNSEITGGRSQITGHFTPEQAKDLANVLKSGKMPAPAHIVQEDIVGPSLGQESINAGIFSFVVALILLMIYMCSMYGFIPGMVANCALILNFFFTLGILSSFQAALTMSADSCYWMVTILIKYWIVWISLSLLPRLLLRRADSTKMEQYLLRDLYITKGNYTSITVVRILG